LTFESTQESQTSPRLVVAVFAGPYHAGTALAALRDAGFTSEQVSVVAKNQDTRREIVEQNAMGEPEDAGADTMLGALTGSALGGIVGLGALVIPGIGPILAAGALATTIGGAAAGAAIGGQIGASQEEGLAGAGLAAALTGQGVPAPDAEAYEAHVRDNAILIAVQAATGDAALAIRQLLVQHEGAEAHIYGGEELRRERI
jgi:hypothetical protein